MIYTKAVIKEYLNCLKIILKHKWYVFLACCKKGHPILGIRHDLSKLRPSEFIPYAKYLKEKDTKNIEFIRSKFLHFKRNKHHFEYWLFIHQDSIYPIKMPQKYVDELLIDWEAANKFYTGGSGNLEQWYAANRDKIILHHETKKFVDRVMNFRPTFFSKI